MTDHLHHELRYRIADAINDSLKKVPGLHRAAKYAGSATTRVMRRWRGTDFSSIRLNPVGVSQNLPEVLRQRAGFAGCTIIAKNYIAMARVLADSFKRFHPESPFFALLLDPIEGCFDPRQE